MDIEWNDVYIIVKANEPETFLESIGFDGPHWSTTINSALVISCRYQLQDIVHSLDAEGIETKVITI